MSFGCLPVDLPAIFSQETRPELTRQEQTFLEQLSCLSSQAIRAGGTEKEQCRQIGQTIFNLYKKKNDGNSLAGKAALQRIYSALSFVRSHEAGELRSAIKDAWVGIGDNSCRWLP